MLDYLKIFLRRPFQGRDSNLKQGGLIRPLRPQDATDYESAICSTEELDLAKSRLFAAMAERGVRCQLIRDEWWNVFVGATREYDEQGSASQSWLINEIGKFDYMNLHFQEWIHVYVLAMRFGLFDLAQVLRETAKMAAIESLHYQGNFMEEAVRCRCMAALLDGGQLDAVRSEMKRFSKSTRSEFAFILSLANAQLFEAWERSDTPEEKLFHELVKGRTIAVVGPASTISPEIGEVGEFDLVVRFNRKEEVSPNGTAARSARCDISYYNSTQTDFILQTQTAIPPPGVAWAVFRKQRDLKTWKQALASNPALRQTGHSRSLKGNGHSPITFRGHLTAMPAAVLDLLKNGAARVKVFQCDLMLTVDRAAGYKNHARTSSEHIQRFMRSCSGSHDPVTQLAILRMAFASGRLEGDCRFMEVMAMNDRQYMRALQDAYGNAARTPLQQSRKEQNA